MVKCSPAGGVVRLHNSPDPCSLFAIHMPSIAGSSQDRLHHSNPLVLQIAQDVRKLRFGIVAHEQMQAQRWRTGCVHCATFPNAACRSIS